MNYFIVTGGSRGFGKALAETLLRSPGNFVITISRNDPGFKNTNSAFFQLDLSKPNEIPVVMENIFKSMTHAIGAVYLINNAGMVTPIGPLDECKPDDIVSHFNVNSVSPAVLSSCFTKQFKTTACEKGIINISSGAAKKPYFGWAPYCSSKASLQMLTDCLTVEYPDFTISAYDPGVLDTEMQAILRSQSPSKLRDVTKFIAFQEDSKLIPTDEAVLKFIDKYFKKFQ